MFGDAAHTMHWIWTRTPAASTSPPTPPEPSTTGSGTAPTSWARSSAKGAADPRYKGVATGVADGAAEHQGRQDLHEQGQSGQQRLVESRPWTGSRRPTSATSSRRMVINYSGGGSGIGADRHGPQVAASSTRRSGQRASSTWWPPATMAGPGPRAEHGEQPRGGEERAHRRQRAGQRLPRRSATSRTTAAADRRATVRMKPNVVARRGSPRPRRVVLNSYISNARDQLCHPARHRAGGHADASLPGLQGQPGADAGPSHGHGLRPRRRDGPEQRVRGRPRVELSRALGAQQQRRLVYAAVLGARQRLRVRVRRRRGAAERPASRRGPHLGRAAGQFRRQPRGALRPGPVGGLPRRLRRSDRRVRRVRVAVRRGQRRVRGRRQSAGRVLPAEGRAGQCPDDLPAAATA